MTDKGHLGFTTHSRSYYADSAGLPRDVTDEIMFGIYHDEGGTSGEAGIRWHSLDGKPALRLEIFDDGMMLVEEAAEFLIALRMACDHNHTPTVNEVESLFLANGFQDDTKTENPHRAEQGRDMDEYTRQLRYSCERGIEKGCRTIEEKIEPILALLDERDALLREVTP